MKSLTTITLFFFLLSGLNANAGFWCPNAGAIRYNGAWEYCKDSAWGPYWFLPEVNPTGVFCSPDGRIRGSGGTIQFCQNLEWVELNLNPTGGACGALPSLKYISDNLNVCTGGIYNPSFNVTATFCGAYGNSVNCNNDRACVWDVSTCYNIW